MPSEHKNRHRSKKHNENESQNDNLTAEKGGQHNRNQLSQDVNTDDDPNFAETDQGIPPGAITQVLYAI